jgi:hypothetical protein
MSATPSRIAVIVATKGRPSTTGELLRLLERQTLRPAVVIFSATEAADIGGPVGTTLNVEFIYGSAGSTIQRNRALDWIAHGADFVVFFDDDFAPSRTWLAQCAQAFQADSSIAGLSGHVVYDGAQSGEISWQQADALLERPSVSNHEDSFERNGLYGCNMAFRSTAIRGMHFDERLVLYGWLEDKDFSRRTGRVGRLIGVRSMLGVHLGMRSGRTSGRRLGFSQVVNPWYLRRKGVMSSKEAWTNIVRALLTNGVKSLWPEKDIDRRGRFHGNLIAVGSLMRGDCRPERAGEL